MTDLVQKLSGVRDLKRILETTVKELGESFGADSCQIMLSNPLDVNSTSICEYKVPGDDDEDLNGLPSVTLPLMLHGRTLGAFSISRRREVAQQEVNSIRGILGEMSDIVRHAQINDVVQRDTFRETFLVEIGNLMAYSLGIGDALFMVVNILGKVLQSSRCLFICTDDNQAGWKCFEFWQQDQVQSCQDYLWPTTDSPVIAQTLLSSVPLHFYEGQQNSYVSPVQEELQFIGVKSLLGVALRSSQGIHGCVILQQCDYRRAWTRGEIDMVQNVADKVAEALVKLPAEKRAREPIMQLHQRIVAPATETHGDDAYAKIDNVRRALKGALGQQVIPSSRQAAAKPKPAAPAAPANKGALQSPKTPTPAGASNIPATPVAPAARATPAPAPQAPLQPQATPQSQGVDVNQPVISPVPKWSAPPSAPAPAAQPPSQFAPPPQVANAQSGLAANAPVAPSAPASPTAPQTDFGTGTASGAPERDPYSDLEFGDYTDFADLPAAPKSPASAAPPEALRPRPGRLSRGREDADVTWGKLQEVHEPTAAKKLTADTAANVAAQEVAIPAIPVTPAAPVTPEPAVPAAAASISIVDLDAIGSPATAAAGEAAAGQWGNLDAIAAPTNTPARGGLGGKMIGKARASSSSGLFNKKKGMLGGADAQSSSASEDKSEVAAPSPPSETRPAMNDEEATAKLKALMDASNERSDYVFSTPGLDMRVLGRIDGWLNEIESKDGFVNGHAMQTAKYAVAIAEQAHLSKAQIDLIRQAALVHDVGKLGSPASVLQKPDEALDDNELLTVMGHPMAGAELLDSFPDLKPLVPIIGTHREEYNGEGYPQGLKGNEIPVEARVIAVANGYHCMVSPMKYGPGMKPIDAQNKIVEEAGKKYDPMFVQALVESILMQKVPAVF
jgi:HD-GYP domain-containing protein (c-di-GMP phosphodiesterase class II)/GAF domain-containing protein